MMSNYLKLIIVFFTVSKALETGHYLFVHTTLRTACCNAYQVKLNKD